MTSDALFLQVEKWQEEPWGNILDAGTGKHSLQWLLAYPRTSLTAITGDSQRAEYLQKEFQSQLRTTDRIFSNNWLNQSLLENEVFDVVIADYLLGAIEGFAPYFQEYLFQRLARHCQKTLYVIGQSPLPTPNTEGEFLIQRLYEMRDACILLAGHRCYREYPLNWVCDNLQRSGFTVLKQAEFPILFGKQTILNQLYVCQSKLRYFADRELARSMSHSIESLKEQILQYLHQHSNISFGSDYVIQAQKGPK